MYIINKMEVTDTVSQTVIYEVLKSQCLNAFIAESIESGHLIALCENSKKILEKVNKTLQSQQVAFTNVITTSLINGNSEAIFAISTSTYYMRFIVFLTMIKLLSTELHGVNKENASTITNEILKALDDITFQNSLFADAEYLAISQITDSNVISQTTEEVKLTLNPDSSTSSDSDENTFNDENESTSHNNESNFDQNMHGYSNYLKYGTFGVIITGVIATCAFILVKSKK